MRASCSTRRNDRLYVLTRFDNSISVDRHDDAAARSRHVAAPQPRAADGRATAGRFLYDAVVTSSNGEASCASCHVFGDLDQLAWDLGNPDDVVTSNPMTIKLIDRRRLRP